MSDGSYRYFISVSLYIDVHVSRYCHDMTHSTLHSTAHAIWHGMTHSTLHSLTHSTLHSMVHLSFEPVHDTAHKKTCSTSEDSDQPAYPLRLIRVFAYRMCLLQPPGYSKRNKQEHFLHWVDVQQADLCLFLYYCSSIHSLTHSISDRMNKLTLHSMTHSILHSMTHFTFYDMTHLTFYSIAHTTWHLRAHSRLHSMVRLIF